MKVTFEALIKQNAIKSLVSGDKGSRLTLEFNAENDEIMDKINRLHRANATVKITIEEND